MTIVIGDDIIVRYTETCFHVLQPVVTPKLYGQNSKRHS